MDLDIMKIGEEVAKEHPMNVQQSRNEVTYRMSLKMLDILFRRGIVTDVEHAQIDALNRQSFSPSLRKVYV